MPDESNSLGLVGRWGVAKTLGVKPRREFWLGPLPKWELIRLARRGQLARARFLVLCDAPVCRFGMRAAEIRTGEGLVGDAHLLDEE